MNLDDLQDPEYDTIGAPTWNPWWIAGSMLVVMLIGALIAAAIGSYISVLVLFILAASVISVTAAGKSKLDRIDRTR